MTCDHDDTAYSAPETRYYIHIITGKSRIEQYFSITATSPQHAIAKARKIFIASEKIFLADRKNIRYKGVQFVPLD